jgi:molecular chaperone GrpE
MPRKKTKREEKEKQMKQEKVEEQKNQNEAETQKEENQSEENNTDVESLLNKIKTLEEDRDRLSDLLKRKVAEFENYKRRTEQEISNIYKYAAEGFIKKIIAVYDDLARSLEHASEKSDINSLIEGLKMVFDKFTKTLEEEGVKRIEAKGKEFDYELHEALMQQPSNEVEPNTVLQEVEPGYTYKDKVLKHTKVIVSQAADNEE